MRRILLLCKKNRYSYPQKQLLKTKKNKKLLLYQQLENKKNQKTCGQKYFKIKTRCISVFISCLLAVNFLSNNGVKSLHPLQYKGYIKYDLKSYTLLI